MIKAFRLSYKNIETQFHSKRIQCLFIFSHKCVNRPTKNMHDFFSPLVFVVSSSPAIMICLNIRRTPIGQIATVGGMPLSRSVYAVEASPGPAGQDEGYESECIFR